MRVAIRGRHLRPAWCACAAMVLVLLGPSAAGATPAGHSAPGGPAPSQGQPPAGVSGIVLDASGAPLPGATVRAVVAGVPGPEGVTGADGRFVLGGLTSGELDVRASAPGFADTRVRVLAPATDVSLVLNAAPLDEVVTVTASRGVEPLRTVESTSVLTSAELLTSAAATVDDALRNTPGFSLFRRSSSRAANPTAQGVTLRGLSGSGASRTLVLADGLALNDPFGSWVSWNRIPQAAIDRVEVVRGAAGDLYGADALGGVIQVLTYDPQRPRLRAVADAASHRTVRTSLFAGRTVAGWMMSAAGEWNRTDGVYTVAADERGRADVPANGDARTAQVTLGYNHPVWRVSARASVYREARSNGTLLQSNDTDWRRIACDASGELAGGAWLARASGGTQEYFNSFSALSADRNAERLTSDQRVPTTFSTFGGQWARSWGVQAFLLGAEGRRTRSTIDERRYSPAGAPSASPATGGVDTSGSVFARTSLVLSERLTLAAGLRGDFWKSSPLAPALPRHSVSFLSPRVSVSWQAGPGVTVRASGYRASRTPTLNELHRGFRVGNTVTTGNALLEPERLTGVEGGILFTRGPISTRVTGFWNRLDDAISNITISATPTLITRERQNADRLLAAGSEIEMDLRPSPRLTIGALVALTASHFARTPKQPEIEGNRVPQVAPWQAGMTVTYANPRVVTLAVQARAFGDQYDDDRNELTLRGFVVVDASATRAIARGLQAFVAVENLFDVDYDVGRTPVRTVGWPRTMRAGLRVFLP